MSQGQTPKNPIPDDLRWQVWERDNFTCHYCGARKRLAIDHKVPECAGGKTDSDNLVTSCVSCNSQKGSMSYEDFLDKLRSDPAEREHVRVFVLTPSGKKVSRIKDLGQLSEIEAAQHLRRSWERLQKTENRLRRHLRYLLCRPRHGGRLHERLPDILLNTLANDLSAFDCVRVGKDGKHEKFCIWKLDSELSIEDCIKMTTYWMLKRDANNGHATEYRRCAKNLRYYVRLTRELHGQKGIDMLHLKCHPIDQEAEVHQDDFVDSCLSIVRALTKIP